jgi:hypothetical protein
MDSYNPDELGAGDSESENIYLISLYPMSCNMRSQYTMSNDLRTMETKRPGQSTLHSMALNPKCVRPKILDIKRVKIVH